jgi:hypothetical protein
LSSVLRGGGGYDGFEGCWAFAGAAWDFEVTLGAGAAGGNVRLVASPDNATLGTASYNKSGWDTYPAGDTWSKRHRVGDWAGVSDVQVLADAAANLWTLFGGSGNATLGVTTLAQSNEWTTLTSWNGFSPAGLAWTPVNATVCVAVVQTVTGLLIVECASGASGAWQELGPPLPSVRALPALAGITILPDTLSTVLVTARDAADANTLWTASAQLFGNRTWTAPTPLTSPQPITSATLKTPAWWDMGDGAAATPVLLLTAGTATGADTVTAFAWQ